MIEEHEFYLQARENVENKLVKTRPKGYKMVIVVRKDLKMGEGKIAAQVGHGGSIFKKK